MSYSPSIFPERREGILGNIVRAVASINLETLETAYHNMRYKFEYHMIHARLKYYSNSKNPRVVHTKLRNQRLLTLRTNPQDPYLVKPGEFLTLGSADRDCNADTLDGFLHYYYELGSLDIESCPPAICESDHNLEDEDGEGLFVARDRRHEAALARNTKAVNGRVSLDLGEKKHGATPMSNWRDQAAGSSSMAGRNRMKRVFTKRSHIPTIKEEQSGAALDLPLESLLPRYLQSSYSSPVTVAPNEPHGQRSRKYDLVKSSTSGNNSSSLLDQDSCYGNYANYSNLLQVVSPVESVSMFRQNSPRFMRSPSKSGDQKPDDKKVWQVVLSDISLSAARLSTGSDGTSREEFESLKGDLTRAKVKEPSDVFAENMKQAKAKFYGHVLGEGDRKTKKTS